MSDTEWTPPAEAVGVAALAVAGAMACDAPCEDCEASARAALIAARPVLLAEALAGLSRRSLELMALERDQARDQRDAAVGTLAAVAALADEADRMHGRVRTERLRAVLTDHADTLAKVRADERERIAQAIEAIAQEPDACLTESQMIQIARAAAIARNQEAADHD